jgi:hypothetical protein
VLSSFDGRQHDSSGWTTPLSSGKRSGTWIVCCLYALLWTHPWTVNTICLFIGRLTLVLDLRNGIAETRWLWSVEWIPRSRSLLCTAYQIARVS